MSPEENAAVIGGMYEAFGRGDIPAIVDLMADDVRWEQWDVSHAGQDGGLPLREERSGKDGVLAFFGEVGRHTIHAFEVRDMMASDRQVTVDVRIDVELPNGGRYEDEELHLYTLNDAGRIVRMRHYIDSAKHLAAFQG